MSDNTARRARAFLEGSGVAPFWRWWRGELVAMMPLRLRAMLSPARAQLALKSDGGEQVLYGAAEGRWVELARWEADLSNEVQLPQAVRDAVAARGRNVLVVLPERDVLRRRIQVPQAISENLRGAIGFELDRYTPFRPDQAYFDVRVLAHDEARQLLAIELGAAPRAPVDRTAEHLGKLGFSVAGMLSDLPEGGVPVLDLLPEDRRVGATEARSGIFLLAPAVVVSLALGALLLPIWIKSVEVRALEPEVNDFRVRAEAAEALHRQLIAQQSEYNFLLEKKHTHPTALEVLDEVSRILPDDTWAHLVELRSDSKNPTKNRELQVRGETGVSGKLISVFEESRLFTQATYKSPVTKGQPGAGDVYHVGAEVKQRPVPEPAAVAAPVSVPPLLRAEGGPAPSPASAPVAPGHTVGPGAQERDSASTQEAPKVERSPTSGANLKINPRHQVSGVPGGANANPMPENSGHPVPPPPRPNP